jgi:formate dehydrogenase subunit gamma
VIVVGLLVLIVTGVGLATLHGGHVFAMFAKVHKWTAIVITPVLLGHIVIAAGVLPGYRGVWRSMHLGGRLKKETADRVWPAWTEQESMFAPPEPKRASSRPSEWSSLDR